MRTVVSQGTALQTIYSQRAIPEFFAGEIGSAAEHDAEEWWHADDGHATTGVIKPGIAGLRMPPGLT